MPTIAVSAALALSFVALHLYGDRLRRLGRGSRTRWLSAAGGAAVAYLFLDLMPQLHRGQAELAAIAPDHWPLVDHALYLAALAGLAAFYGLERLAVRSRDAARTRAGDDRTDLRVFRVHVGAFALYNVLIGYLLLQQEDAGTTGLLVFGLAIGLHLFVMDAGLRAHHKAPYDARGRYVLALALVAGWTAGWLVELPGQVVDAAFAFLAGAIVLNVLKEELPRERDSCFPSFVLGAGGYAALLIAAA